MTGGIFYLSWSHAVKLISCTQLASLAGCSKLKVRRFVKQGVIPEPATTHPYLWNASQAAEIVAVLSVDRRTSAYRESAKLGERS